MGRGGSGRSSQNRGGRRASRVEARRQVEQAVGEAEGPVDRRRQRPPAHGEDDGAETRSLLRRGLARGHGPRSHSSSALSSTEGRGGPRGTTPPAACECSARTFHVTENVPSPRAARAPPNPAFSRLPAPGTPGALRPTRERHGRAAASPPRRRRRRLSGSAGARARSGDGERGAPIMSPNQPRAGASRWTRACSTTSSGGRSSVPSTRWRREPLMQVPAIAASFAALGKKYAAVTAGGAAVSGDQAQLRRRRRARRLAHGDGRRAGQPQGAGGEQRHQRGRGHRDGLHAPPGARRRGPSADAPALVIVRPGKVHGKATVTVYETPGRPRALRRAGVRQPHRGLGVAAGQRQAAQARRLRERDPALGAVRAGALGIAEDWSRPSWSRSLIGSPPSGGARPAGARRLSILVLPRRRSRRPLQLMARRRSNGPRPTR